MLAQRSLFMSLVHDTAETSAPVLQISGDCFRSCTVEVGGTADKVQAFEFVLGNAGASHDKCKVGEAGFDCEVWVSRIKHFPTNS